MEPAPTGEKGGLEMSCPRCGGVLAAELAEAMRELVCPNGGDRGPILPLRRRRRSGATESAAGDRRHVRGGVVCTHSIGRGTTMMRDGKRVLVVDDDARARQETALLLEQAGFPVVQACDGLHALSEMQKRRGDVVVTDCHMPHLNGLDFLAQSRDDLARHPGQSLFGDRG